jgi:Tfp pilus assembly protein PilO
MAVASPPRFTLPKLPRREKTAVPRSQAERLWLIGGGLVALVLFLIGYFFFISPQRAKTSDIDAQITTAKDQNALLQNRIDMLREQSKDLSKVEAAVAQARLALPTSSGVSDFLRSLQSLGNATLTDVTSLSVGAPTDVTSITGAQPSASASSSAPADANAPAVPQSVEPASPIYALPISATVTGTPGSLEKFLDQLQAVQPRAVLITEINQGGTAALPGTGNPAAGKTSLKLTMQAFVAPNSPAENASLSAASH